MALRQLITVVVYNDAGNASLTRVTSALLMSRLTFFSLSSAQRVNSVLWSAMLNPSEVYETNDFVVSGAYGGSRYMKSPATVRENASGNEDTENTTFLMSAEI